MTETEKNTKLSLGEEDEPVEWPDEVWARAEIAGVRARPAPQQ